MSFFFVLKGPVRKALEEACDKTLAEIIQILKPGYLIGVGNYAKEKCSIVQEKYALTTKVLYLIHPSPIIPKNGDWQEKAEKFLNTEHLMPFFKTNA